MRLFLGFLVLVWAVQLRAAPNEIEMVFVGGKVDYVGVGERPFQATVPSWDWRNLDSFVIKYRGWSLLGEYVYVAQFFWALNPRELRGASRTVNFQDISKYPDLAKRYQAIRPSRVGFVLRARIVTESGTQTLRFKVTDNDLVYFGSRSGQNYSTPGSPPRWKDAVSFDLPQAFTATDYTTDDELKKALEGFRSVAELPMSDPDVFLDVTWPDQEIDAIGELFEKYEREGKKLKEDYAFLDDAPKEQPFAGPPERAQPVDFRPKAGEVYREGNEVGIKVNGQIVFRSTRHASASPFDDRKTHFFFRVRDGDGSEIYDTKGRQVKIGGYSRFDGFRKNSRGKGALIAVPDSRAVVYRTQKEYALFELGVMTQGEFDRFARRDGTPDPPKERKPRPKGEPEGVIITFSTYRFEFVRTELLEVDEKFNVIAREPAYSANSLR